MHILVESFDNHILPHQRSHHFSPHARILRCLEFADKGRTYVSQGVPPLFGHQLSLLSLNLRHHLSDPGLSKNALHSVCVISFGEVFNSPGDVSGCQVSGFVLSFLGVG